MSEFDMGGQVKDGSSCADIVDSLLDSIFCQDSVAGDTCFIVNSTEWDADIFSVPIFYFNTFPVSLGATISPPRPSTGVRMEQTPDSE